MTVYGIKVDGLRCIRFKKWYIVVLVVWAILIVPGYILGFLLAGGDFGYQYRTGSGLVTALFLDALFISPILLFPLGTSKR